MSVPTRSSELTLGPDTVETTPATPAAHRRTGRTWRLGEAFRRAWPVWLLALVSYVPLLLTAPEADFTGFVGSSSRVALLMSAGVVALTLLLAAFLVRQGLLARTPRGRGGRGG